MDKSDFYSWKMHPVTELFMKDMIENLNEVLASLINNAGDDPLKDKEKVGMKKGLEWLLDWEPNFKEEPDA